MYPNNHPQKVRVDIRFTGAYSGEINAGINLVNCHINLQIDAIVNEF